MSRLSSEQMAQVALEALVNARRLFDDAVRLRLAGRLPSAFMVAGLANDELGKPVLVSSFYGVRKETDEEWRKFWRRFRNHESKLGDALMGAWIGDLFTDKPPPDVAGFHQERLLATYVDVDPVGAVSVPAQLITEHRVDEVLSLIEGELGFCESVLARATPTEFAEVLESMRTSETAEEMRTLIEDGGPEAPLAFAIAARTGMSRDEAMAFARQANDLFGGLRPGDAEGAQGHDR